MADKRGDANYTIIDIAEYKLPLLGESGTELKAAPVQADSVNQMLDQVIPWSTALKTIR